MKTLIKSLIAGTALAGTLPAADTPATQPATIAVPATQPAAPVIANADAPLVIPDGTKEGDPAVRRPWSDGEVLVKGVRG